MARTEEQNEKIRDATRTSIKNAALDKFSMKGLYATRIQDIAESAGIAQGLLYHYYPSKEAIYVDLIDDGLEKIIEASLCLRDMDGTAKEKIDFALKSILQTIQISSNFAQNSRFITQAVNSTAIPPEVQKVLDEKRDIPYQIIAEILAAGQEEGSVVDGDPRTLSTLFWANINGLSAYFTTWKNPGELPDYRLISSMFFRRE